MAWTSKDPVQYLMTLYSIKWSVHGSHADWWITKSGRRKWPLLYCVRKRRHSHHHPAVGLGHGGQNPHLARLGQWPRDMLRENPGHSWLSLLPEYPVARLSGYYYLAAFVPLLTHVPGNRRRSINTELSHIDRYPIRQPCSTWSSGWTRLTSMRPSLEHPEGARQPTDY